MFKGLKARFKRLPRWVKGTLVAGGIGFISLILFIASISIYISNKFSSRIHDNIADVPFGYTALVLGTSSKLSSGQPNLYFENRMNAATMLYHSGKVDKIIVSGDNSEIYYNEPRDMKNALIEMGVHPDDIILDYAGFRTFDSVVRVKEVFGQNKIVVVSQKFHIQRALFIAEAKGIEAIGFVSEDPNTTIKTKLREYPARVKAFLDCYIIRTKPRFLGEPIDINTVNDTLAVR